MREECPRCRLRFERIDGHSTGALGVNTVVSIVAVVTVGVLGFILTFPELPLAPLVASVIAVAAIFPVVFYPFSKTLWTALDVRLRPLEPGEVRPGYGDWIVAALSDR